MGTITLTPALTKKAMAVAIKAGLVTMLWGSPGIGKSDVVEQTSNDYSLELIDVRLASYEPPDMNGFPDVNQVTKRAQYLPFDTFPLEGDPLPPGKQGWLIFLDEFPLADRAVQKAAYKFLLNRMVGNFKLHPNVVIVCAGNLATDNAMVEEMSSALDSRLLHIEMTVCHMGWIEWAEANNIDHRIVSWIRHQPNKLHTFDPETKGDEKTYACPRTYGFVHKLLTHMEITDDVCMPLLAGAISEGVAREFIAYLTIYRNQPTIDEIQANPGTVAVPDSPGGLFMMTGTLGAYADAKNIATLMTYLERFPIEFQVIGLRTMAKRDSSLLLTPPIAKWCGQNGTTLL